MNIRKNKVMAVVAYDDEWLKTFFEDSARRMKQDGMSGKIDYVDRIIEFWGLTIKFFVIHPRISKMYRCPGAIGACRILIQTGLDEFVPYETIEAMGRDGCLISAVDNYFQWVTNHGGFDLSRENWGTSAKPQFDCSAIVDALEEWASENQ